MDRLTVKRKDGRWALANSADASNLSMMNKIPLAIERLSAYEDAEERGELVRVVRCKDCRYCHNGYCERFDDLIPFGVAHYEWENWFCADGKKRDAEPQKCDTCKHGAHWDGAVICGRDGQRHERNGGCDHDS